MTPPATALRGDSPAPANLAAPVAAPAPVLAAAAAPVLAAAAAPVLAAAAAGAVARDGAAEPMLLHAIATAPFRQLSPHANAQVLNRLHGASTPQGLLEDVIGQQYPGGIALVSSFGADSAVLLHMVAQIDRATPVLFLETGMLFAETLEYQRDLGERLGLTDLRLLRPDPADLAALDPQATLHQANADACCSIRKTLPLRTALAPFGAWITGRKRFQAATRARLAVFEEDGETGRLKVNPLADWDGARVRDYMRRHDLAPHPLVARGYPSIGCAPCTTPVRPGEDPRAGRWRGKGKDECGIHFDGTAWVRTQAATGVVATFP